MILVRHGQSEFNVVYAKTRIDPGIRDPELTELGRRQAAAAAQTIKGQNVHRLIASPYRRAIQTAEIIAETLGLDIVIDPFIGERAAFTCDIGTPRSILEKDWPHLQFEHVEETWWPEHEESEQALDVRGRAFRTRMNAQDDWRGTVAITHWGFIRTLTGHRVGNCSILRFDPAAEHPGGGTVVSDTDVC
ncbi:MAG: histidine phosphatase family protein [Alphaproteobacteria bacterium]|nr:histidine phosphatase family protein [Alphaproteobacteria bacterium]